MPTKPADADFRTSTAANLRRLRESHGLKQGQLAKKAKVSRGTINAIERERCDGAPSLRILARLAAALGVTAADLLQPPTEAPRA